MLDTTENPMVIQKNSHKMKSVGSGGGDCILRPIVTAKLPQDFHLFPELKAILETSLLNQC